MIQLRKSVSRITVDPLETFGPNRNRPFVVTLAPGDLLTFRPLRRRNEVSARLSDIYRMILIGRSNAERMAKLRDRKKRLEDKRELRRLNRGIRA